MKRDSVNGSFEENAIKGWSEEESLIYALWTVMRLKLK
jgi:hypothetical protein